MAGTDPTGRTRASLLLRVQNPADRDSWNEFVSIYTPQIYLWAMRFGLQDADAEDATQVVLIKLVHSLRKFEYDRSKGAFRGWLRTVSQNAVRDLFRNLNRVEHGLGGLSRFDQLHNLEARDPQQELERILEHEARKNILAEAEEFVRARVKPANWRAWKLTARNGVSAADAAAELGLKISDVYVARTRITKMLRAAVENLHIDDTESGTR
ncbi:MAG: sigma-70 family RNA polymerase sigma factor [Fuerstiella sp.]|nr:sigma-70 family RNA polymerase sigma factor [Fuerstiella sp.]